VYYTGVMAPRDNSILSPGSHMSGMIPYDSIIVYYTGIMAPRDNRVLSPGSHMSSMIPYGTSHHYSQ
jgi:hypothetical protein